MKLSEYLSTQRKRKYSSAGDFIKKTELGIPLTNYYYYERGEIIPKIEDWVKILKALSLNIKFGITLWLHEHLKDEDLKLHFPLPELSSDNKKVKIFEQFNSNETMTISRGHVKYLTENRLARILLTYLYINRKDQLNLNEVFEQFSKHKKSDIEKQLRRLIDFGYIEKNEAKKYCALAKYIYVPTTQHYDDYRKEIMLDIIKTSQVNTPISNQYGNYEKGLDLYYRRTLTPHQLLHILNLIRSFWNELCFLKDEPGQEFNMCLFVGALNEKK